MPKPGLLLGSSRPRRRTTGPGDPGGGASGALPCGRGSSARPGFRLPSGPGPRAGLHFPSARLLSRCRLGARRWQAECLQDGRLGKEASWPGQQWRQRPREGTKSVCNEEHQTLSCNLNSCPKFSTLATSTSNRLPLVLSASLRHTCPSRKAQCRVSLSATDCYIVHEIYNGENAQDQFEYELEQALEAQYKYIVIEPTRIGDETARWITVGNCLHKTAVLAGTACLFTPLALPLDYSHYISLPAGVLSLACCTLYGISWQFDPCCKYQVEYDAYKLSRLPLHTLTSSTPVVLVRKDDLHRKRLHNTIALAALVYCVKKIYELYAV
ncbi:transmembrane protein 11, mitochondrial isoform X1 [Pongo pygmaeus]|uniref:transmembrane protein 11, mitochondrial isoform X1 n=1 Tax=Pongo pygmaeus TaxID=9600 RepID=UPI0023E25F88|nr:transmembrane protein 11, mitochondrial isoform X1 [Pongo pygmaeus]